MKLNNKNKTSTKLTLQSYSVLLPNKLELLTMLKWDKVAAFGKPVVPWNGQYEKSLRKVWEKSFSKGLRTDSLDPEQAMTGMITEVNRMFMGSSCDSFLCRSWSCCRWRLLPACITSSKLNIPGCWLSRTTTERSSGSLTGKQKRVLWVHVTINNLHIRSVLINNYWVFKFN